MTGGSLPAPGAGAGDELDRALQSYAAFLAHQLAEVAVLLGGAVETPPLAAARARLDQMLDDLRDLSATARAPVTVDLAALAHDVAAGLSEPGRRVCVLAAGDLPAVRGDPALLRALLGHLMRMSLAASRSSAEFTLRAAPGANDRIDVELEERTEPVAVIAASRSLLPFERPTGTGPLLGAGVSGPAVANIVASHGGGIEMRGDAGSAIAAFDLPAAGA